jgi:transposase InsO family protein
LWYCDDCFTSACASLTVRALRSVFSREGIPLVLVTDNGTHFVADEVRSFLTKLGVHFMNSAPRHPQSNGLAENFVRSLKTAIMLLLLLHSKNC